MGQGSNDDKTMRELVTRLRAENSKWSTGDHNFTEILDTMRRISYLSLEEQKVDEIAKKLFDRMKEEITNAMRSEVKLRAEHQKGLDAINRIKLHFDRIREHGDRYSSDLINIATNDLESALNHGFNFTKSLEDLMAKLEETLQQLRKTE